MSIESKTNSHKSIIVSDFFKNPSSPRAFNSFFNLAFNLTMAFLKSLKSKGWRLPIHDADEDHSISDIAIDVLSELFDSKPDRSFYIIFDYYRRLGITRFDENLDELYDQFRILLWSFTKQALYRLTNQENPQIARLKKRIKEILGGSEYSFHDSGREYIYHRDYKDDLRVDRPQVSKEKLLEIVETAYLCSKNRPEWCRSIFRIINDEQEFSNLINSGFLIDSIISVNSRYVELDGIFPPNTPPPQSGLWQRTIKEAMSYALESVKTNQIARFIIKGRITDREKELLLKAARNYLMDLGNGGETDSIPTYFREVMPEETHKQYLDKYKFIFETIINGAREYFGEFLRKNL